MQDLTVSLVQFSPSWENRKDNLQRLDTLLAPLDSDLIVLPEMFNSGFTMNAGKVSESMNGATVKWMLDIAIQKECCITGSIVIEENGKYYNRLIWMNAYGVIKYYDKKHLFRMGNENLIYKKGENRNVMLCKGWKICPLICYDLRFPVWSRNTVSFDTYDYDLLIYIASWPNVRANHWKQLLISRAIENQTYVIGVNRVGIDGNDIAYNGDSTIIDYNGETIHSKSNDEVVLSATLSRLNLNDFRKSFPVWRDADSFELNIDVENLPEIN